MAAATNADHELRWRLHNHVADPAWVASAAAAWRGGHPAPSGPPLLRLVAAPGRVLENSGRLELIRGALTGGDQTLQPGGRATAGDVAFVRGDVVTAAGAYLKDLKTDASWTGFALAAGDAALIAHLETVVAVSRALDHDAPDPTVLKRWLRSEAAGPN